MFAPRYNPTKLKLNLKLAITRLQMLQKKNDNAGVLARKEVAKLLEKGKDELARIKVEQIIRDDYYMESMELMEMYLNLMIARFGLIETVKHCDLGIQEAITTVVWATPRMQGDVSELKTIKTLVQSRYGRDFVEEALENRGNTVNSRVIHKLSVIQPENTLVDAYLKTIAEKYNVAWTPTAAPEFIDTMPSKFDELINLGPMPAMSEPALAPMPYAPPAQAAQFPPGSASYPSAAPQAYPPAAAPSAGYPQQQHQPQPRAMAMGQSAGGFAQPAAAAPPAQSMQNPMHRPPMQANPYDSLPEAGSMGMDSLPSVPGSDPFPTSLGAHPPAASASAGIDEGFPDLPAFPSIPGSEAPGSASAQSTDSALPDFDELNRRFMQLKGKK